MKTKRELQETPIYVASIWWRNCEPFLTIVGGSEKAVEMAIEAEMLRVAGDAYEQQETKKRERDDFLLDMAPFICTTRQPRQYLSGFCS